MSEDTMDRPTKLNKRERHKAQLSPYEYFPQIETLDFTSISEGDGFYLQDFGIFNNPMEEEEFTLRLRIPAGRISTVALNSIAQIAQKYDLEILLSARAGIQLHGLNSENTLDIFKQINTIGISTWQTFGDNIRNIVTDVYDGRGFQSEIETYPLIIRMQEYFLQTPHLVGMLPRRISVGISGTRANVTSFFANDLYFGLARKNDEWGFNVYIGGKNSEIARNANIFLRASEVVAFFIAFIKAFNKHGSRSTRSRTRLFYLLEDIGIEAFKTYILDEYQTSWQSAGEAVYEPKNFDLYEQLTDGSYSFCYETDFGRVTVDELTRIANFAELHNAEVRLSMDHNIYLFDLPEPSVPFENLRESVTVVPCAGSHYCPYSFWDIKNDVDILPLDKIKKHRIQIGISGCAKGCGRHQHTDIGLIGLRTNSFGNADKAARIYFGAGHSDGTSVGSELYPMVPKEHIYTLLDLIIDEYEESGYDTFEAFSTYTLSCFSLEFLSLWFLVKLQTHSKTTLISFVKSTSKPHENQFIFEKEWLEHHFSSEPFLALIEERFDEAIRHMSKELWTSGKRDETIAPQIKKLLYSKKYWESP